jgi:hypothetical protein
MPVELNNITQQEVEEAANEFWNDFTKVVDFQYRLTELVKLQGRNAQFDTGLKTLLDKQRKLLFDLRSLYAGAYDLLSENRRSIVFRWIVKATGELKEIGTALGSLGVVPLVIVGGVLLTGAIAALLVGWHRQISVQGQALSNQEKMIPLVESGALPAEVLRPAPVGGLTGMIGNLSTVALIVAALWFASKFMDSSE